MTRNTLMAGIAGLAMIFAGAEAGAQGRGNSGRIPPGHLPAPGECRVWIDGVPPGRQPAPTSCARARYDAARYGGRVVYGDQVSRPGNGKAKGKYKKNKGDDRWYGRRDRDDRDDDRYDRDRRRREDDRYDGRYDTRRRRSDGTYDARVPSTTTRSGSTTTTRTRDRVCADTNRDGKCDFGDNATNGRTVPVQPR